MMAVSAIGVTRRTDTSRVVQCNPRTRNVLQHMLSKVVEAEVFAPSDRYNNVHLGNQQAQSRHRCSY